MENKNKPVYPVVMQQISECDYRAAKPNDDIRFQRPMEGITKREYFAAMAMQGLVIWDQSQNNTNEWIAKEAVALADALLVQLDK